MTSRIGRACGWGLVIVALLASLALLFYDQMQTHYALLETEIRLDNAELQRDIYKQRWHDCNQMTDQRNER